MGGGAGTTARVIGGVGGSSTLIVRTARRDDLATITTIEQASFGDPWSEEAFASVLDLSHIRFLVAEEHTDKMAVVGYVVAIVVVGEAEIANLAVAAIARRRGIGALLLDRVVDYAMSSAVSALYLEVRESNLAAQALYRSRHLLPVGRRRSYYRHPADDALLLRRELKVI